MIKTILFLLVFMFLGYSQIGKSSTQLLYRMNDLFFYHENGEYYLKDGMTTSIFFVGDPRNVTKATMLTKFKTKDKKKLSDAALNFMLFLRNAFPGWGENAELWLLQNIKNPTDKNRWYQYLIKDGLIIELVTRKDIHSISLTIQRKEDVPRDERY